MTYSISQEHWRKEAIKRYGEKAADWKFRCPSCGQVTAVSEWRSAGAEGQIAYSCIGRVLGTNNQIWSKDGPCNYAGGGLFRLNPVIVIDDNGKEHQMFDFADDPLIPLTATPESDKVNL